MFKCEFKLIFMETFFTYTVITGSWGSSELSKRPVAIVLFGFKLPIAVDVRQPLRVLDTLRLKQGV